MSIDGTITYFLFVSVFPFGMNDRMKRRSNGKVVRERKVDPPVFTR